MDVRGSVKGETCGGHFETKIRDTGGFLTKPSEANYEKCDEILRIFGCSKDLLLEDRALYRWLLRFRSWF